MSKPVSRKQFDGHLWGVSAKVTLQRFISRDPIGLRGGANLYSYVENSPAGAVDPAGMRRIPTPGGAVQAMMDTAAATARQILQGLARAGGGGAATTAADATAASATAAGASRVVPKPNPGLTTVLALHPWQKLGDGTISGRRGSGTATGPEPGGGKFPYEHKNEGPAEGPVFPPIPPPHDLPPPPRGPGECDLFIDQVVNFPDGGTPTNGRADCSNSKRMCLYLCENGTFRIVLKPKNKRCDPSFRPLM
ncbi:MAG: hypothetical protein KF760_30255 [Candidatus Eremiobacteraeota bacterium]|nr:hypothetical protein [Candidatus Eremiobacteraeota bacterium]MCW5868136.1 hypothetical protein [Candidatus Eremiobacteraeota bacterium]